MPWLDYVPEPVDLEYWGTYPDGTGMKVSKWPHPQTARVSAWYRMRHGRDFYPSAQRFLVRNFFSGIVPPPLPSNEEIWSWIDLLPIGPGHIQGTLPPNSYGIDLRVSVRSYDVLPSLGVPGVRIEIENAIAGQGSSIYWEEWDPTNPTDDWQPTAENWTNQATIWGYIDDPLWPYANITQRFQSCSECYLFPRQSIPTEDFANFNGTDSYIRLSFDALVVSQPFVISADIRLKNVTTFWPIFGRDGTGGFLGMDGADLIWGNLRLTTTWVPVLNTWFSWRLEFEQPLQLKYRLFIDNNLVLDRTTNRQNVTPNILGVYRHGVPNTIWGDFDMRNLLYLRGAPGLHSTELNMPLQVNALDIGPKANNGTTFNMLLPSV